MKTIFCFLLLLNSFSPAFSQQFNLYNSRTLYDVFENPSQSAYQIDTSRRMAFNFFIPTVTVNAIASGSANPALKRFIFDGVIKGDNILVGEDKFNTIAFNTNTYVAMIRWLHSVTKSREIGLSWQIRDDGRIKATNETLAIFDNYDMFANETSVKGLFNNKGYNQSYHQFSLAYRQDVSKRLSLGVKGSLLSGITYTSFKVIQSDLIVDEEFDIINVSVAGNLRSSFKFDNFEKESIKPKFKNPGLALTAGSSYKLRNGWFFLANLKDIGFIKWDKNSYEYNFNASNIEIDNASNPSADNRLADSLDTRISQSSTNRSYFSPLNGKAELLINKNYGKYQPNLILSKSVYYEGADIALTNNYHVRNFVLTASANYNTSKYLAIGGQLMFKSPNTEFFLGSDHFFRTLETMKYVRKEEQESYPSGYTGASFYLGFALKFGRVLEHPANANFVPGFNEPWGARLFKRIFKKKQDK